MTSQDLARKLLEGTSIASSVNSKQLDDMASKLADFVSATISAASQHAKKRRRRVVTAADVVLTMRIVE